MWSSSCLLIILVMCYRMIMAVLWMMVCVEELHDWSVMDDGLCGGVA